MVNISHITKKILQERPYIHEALEKDLINIMALSEMIQPDVEKELGKVKVSAISMAIRRYIEKSKEKYKKVRLSKSSYLLVKSGLLEISIRKSQTLQKKLVSLFKIVDFDIGDTLNIIHGNYEILLVSNEKYEKKFLEILKGEKIKAINRHMASVSMEIPKEMINAPGFYYSVTKTLAMNNISIMDIVNTETEATFIVADKDVAKAYDVLKKEISIEYYQ
ncbi:MAG: hypothetical protein NDI94_00220 [Candidatus Woesearchaeota archaeon]|nr:hypothetical protein [Candidatus Woesearchaeota archaeon]